MKFKALLAIAAMTFAATAANAFDVTRSVKVDTTLESFYNLEAKQWSGTYEIKPMYALTPRTSLFVQTAGDLKRASYQGVDVGLEYQLQTGLKMKESYVQAKVAYDQDGKYKGVLVGAKVKF